MRLDRPRHKADFWGVDKGKYQDGPHWDPDEMRALAGAFYLSSRYLTYPGMNGAYSLLLVTTLTYGSSSSVLMQKSKHVQYTSYMYDYCEHLTRQAQYPTDKHLSYIIRLQKLIEDIDSMMASEGSKAPLEIERIKEECTGIRVSLPFSVHESRKPRFLSISVDIIAALTNCLTAPINMQLSLLELLLSQSSLGGSTFGIDKFHEVQAMSDSASRLLEWLSTSISAVRSLISMVLVLPAGEERPVANTIWLALYCALALGVRLDLLAAHRGPSGPAYHLRRFLDMPHTLRQMVKRTESAAGGAELDDQGDRDVFHHMARRCRRLEDWYLERINRGQGGLPPSPASRPKAQGHGEGDAAQAASGSDTHPSVAFDSIQVASADVPRVEEGLLGNSLYYDADMAFGNVLFGDPRGYPVDFERWTTFE